MNIRKHVYQHTLLAQEDRVIAHAPIVMGGGKFIGASGVVKCVAGAPQNIAHAVMLMARGVVAMFPDFSEGGINSDELWDSVVPKDEAWVETAATPQVDYGVQVGDVDTDVFAEPGEPNLTILAEGDSIWGKRVFDYSKIMSFADVSDGHDATDSPETFRPNDVFRTDISQSVSMGGAIPGVFMLALGAPALTATSGAVIDIITGREWLMLRHMHQLLNDAWMNFAGLDESSAESPFVDVARLIIEMTEPLVVEETPGAWTAQSFNCWNETWIDTFVPYDSVVPTTLQAG